MTVGSGMEAISYIKSRRSNTRVGMEILLIDFKIHDMDGLATAKTIRNELGDAADPIIIMVTAFSNNQFLDHPDSHFADAVLTKPVTPSTLFNAVSRAIRVRQGGEEQAPTRSMRRLTGLRILVVDDSEINRDVAQRVLSLEGAKVILASDGQQGVNWLLTHPDAADLVLMDIQMPVMNGYEATRRIRREPALANLPVIALTAGAFLEQQELANEAGMNGFIAKPFDVDAAIALIIKVTGLTVVAPPTPDLTLKASASPADEGYPGVDIGAGLARVRNRSVYQKLLTRFAKDNADAASRIRSVNRQEGAQLAHKLKGAAGNLALPDVAELAGQLERELGSDADAAPTLEQLQSAIATAIEGIQRYISAPTGND
jgi:CheY-like chemotaxis protein